MEPFESPTKLSELPLGGRLLVRSRTDWRVAVVSRVADDLITISVSSPKGRNYRIRRKPDSKVSFSSDLWFLNAETSENWNENYAAYDRRW